MRLVIQSGQSFEVRARKEGFVPASASFEFGYSIWDYGGMSLNLELNLELVRQ